LRYKELLTVAKKERESRKNQNIVSLQAWCEAPGEGCALPVKEAFDYYMEAKNSYAPMFENKLSSTSFANMVADNVAFAIQFATAPILIVHPDKDLVPIEDVLFYYKRAPEPKRLVVPSGLHSTTYAYRKHFDMSAAEAVAWFKQYLGQ
jgi:alpha-beta hydrolase superfamily lysophospholipase